MTPMAALSGQWPSVSVVGCGNMGAGIMRSLVAAGCDPGRITGIEQSAQLREQLRQQLGCGMHADIDTGSVNSQVVVLAVKPHQASQVLPALKKALAADALLLSIMAGVELARLRRGLGGHVAIVRAMPNLPVIVQSGVTAMVAAADLPRRHRDLASKLFAATGVVVWLQEEGSMDIVTAISGSGPAYFFYVMECLEKSAVALGLEQASARSLVLHTALGAARLATSDGAADPASLRVSVTSPGGTTEAALRQLDLAKVAAALDAAVVAARDRSAQLRDLPEEK